MAVYAVIGVAIGAVVRKQIAVIVTALVWMLAVEHLVVPSHPSIGRWMPLASTISLLQLRPVYDPDHALLPYSRPRSSSLPICSGRGWSCFPPHAPSRRPVSGAPVTGWAP